MAHNFRRKTGKKTNNYLDDFLFAALIKVICDRQVEVFLQLCKTINFPVSLDKTFWGTQLLVFLVIFIDTLKQTVSIPEEKRIKAVNQITDILS